MIHQGAPDREGVCTGMGDHYNPFNSIHGNLLDEVRHAGDLGNIWADHRGRATFQIKSDLVWLAGPYSVVDRSIVIYSGFDRGSKSGKKEPK